MDIEIKRTDDVLEVTVTGHTKTEICNGVSCLLWSLAAWAVNYAEEEHTFRVGESYIKVKKCSPDIADFVETAFEQIAANDDDIKLKRGF